MQKTGEKIKILIRPKGYKQADFAEMSCCATNWKKCGNGWSTKN